MQLGPGFDMYDSVVALRGEIEQAKSDDLSDGEIALPVKRLWEVSVTEVDEVEAFQAGPKDWQIGHDFDTHQFHFRSVHLLVLRPDHYS